MSTSNTSPDGLFEVPGNKILDEKAEYEVIDTANQQDLGENPEKHTNNPASPTQNGSLESESSSLDSSELQADEHESTLDSREHDTLFLDIILPVGFYHRDGHAENLLLGLCRSADDVQIEINYDAPSLNVTSPTSSENSDDEHEDSSSWEDI